MIMNSSFIIGKKREWGVKMFMIGKWIKMMNFKLGNERWKVKWSTMISPTWDGEKFWISSPQYPIYLSLSSRFPRARTTFIVTFHFVSFYLQLYLLTSQYRYLQNWDLSNQISGIVKHIFKQSLQVIGPTSKVFSYSSQQIAVRQCLIIYLFT